MFSLSDGFAGGHDGRPRAISRFNAEKKKTEFHNKKSRKIQDNNNILLALYKIIQYFCIGSESWYSRQQDPAGGLVQNHAPFYLIASGLPACVKIPDYCNKFLARHSREGGNQLLYKNLWISASAEMTPAGCRRLCFCTSSLNIMLNNNQKINYVTVKELLFLLR